MRHEMEARAPSPGEPCCEDQCDPLSAKSCGCVQAMKSLSQTGVAIDGGVKPIVWRGDGRENHTSEAADDGQRGVDMATRDESRPPI